ncbi:hypothetical protein [Mesorhizobium sp. M0088]|uniref:hypothetical protein n=1 Tax=Mesorhizobium sp. M0088 TaxID=2956873 RepID=UPI00333627E8
MKDKFYSFIFRYFYFMIRQGAVLTRSGIWDSALQTTLSVDGGWTAQQRLAK